MKFSKKTLKYAKTDYQRLLLNNPGHIIYKTLKRNAKLRKRMLSLTREEFILWWNTTKIFVTIVVKHLLNI